jgi:hypothetical protein
VVAALCVRSSAANQELLIGLTTPELRGGRSALCSFVGGQPGTTGWPHHSGTSGWSRYFVLFRRRPIRSYWLASPLRNCGVVAALCSFHCGQSGKTDWPHHSGTSRWSRRFVFVRRRPIRSYWLASPLRNFGVVAVPCVRSSAANRELLVGLTTPELWWP